MNAASAHPGRSMRMRALAACLCLVSLFAACDIVDVIDDGAKDVVGPSDPDFAVLCVDSTLVDTTRVCYGQVTATIRVTIPNPLFQPADTTGS